MKAKIFLAMLILGFGLVSCVQKEKITKPIGASSHAAPTADKKVAQESTPRGPAIAIEGRVMMDGQIPSALSTVQLTIIKEVKGKLAKVAQLSTDSEGKFSVPRKLTGGRYVVYVTDPRYKGKLDVVLNSSVKDLVVLAQKKK